MVLIKEKIPKKTSKKPNTTIVKESSFMKSNRLYDEKEKKLAQDVQDAELAKQVEKKRMRKIVVPYLDELQERLVKDNLLYFWIFPDKPGFTKIKGYSWTQMENLLKSNVEKYKNRLIANVNIRFYHNDKPKSMFLREDIHLTTDINVYPIDKNGVMCGHERGWGIGVAWRPEDFKISKFSFKLMELLYVTAVNKTYTNATMYGYPFSSVIDALHEYKVKTGNLLQPLYK